MVKDFEEYVLLDALLEYIKIALLEYIVNADLETNNLFALKGPKLYILS